MKVLANDGISESGKNKLEEYGFKVDLTKVSQEQLVEHSRHNAATEDAVQRMTEHLSANGLSETKITAGVSLTTDGVRVTGEYADAVKKLDREHYRKGFTLPNA